MIELIKKEPQLELTAALGAGYEKGYNEGYSKGYTEGEAKGDEQGYSRGLTEGFDNGREFLLYATCLANMFEKATFPENSKLTLNIPNCTKVQSTFQYTKGLKEIKLVSNTEMNISFIFAFQGNMEVEVIDLTEYTPKITSFQSALTGCGNLIEIKGELDFSETTNTTNAFTYMGKLQEVRIKANTAKISFGFPHSPKLSNESVQSIINGLADMMGGSAQTVSLHATVKANLSVDQYLAVAVKNWNIS